MPENTKNKNPIFETIDDMPFAGKFMMKEAWVGYETAPDKKKTRRFLGAAALYGTLALAHLVPVKYGMDSFSLHVQDALHSKDTMDTLLAGVDASFALAMGGVAARQFALVGELTKKQAKWYRERNKIPEAERVPAKREYKYGVRAMTAATIVTLAGSGAGMISGLDAHDKGPLHDLRVESGNEVISTLPDHAKELYETNTIHIEQSTTDKSSELPQEG